MMIVASALMVAGASNAFAADAAAEDIAPIASGAYDWSGFYVGIHGGYSFGQSNYDVYEPGPAALYVISNPDPDGYLLGAHAGYIRQFSNGFVFGGEADLSYSSSKGSDYVSLITPTGPIADDNIWFESEIKWTASARARFGYAMDRFLPYATAGVAAARVESSLNYASYPYQQFEGTHVGWTAGIGTEYAMTEKVSIRAEYRYSDYGDQDFTTVPLSNRPTKIDFQSHDIRLGVSYKF
ncbi:outer membrane protein [Aminobacter sp. UC22_36]|uniref:outer membrane protein n=1 Tax=Aminobacter sp. UC22_36 TaxID=3374549 RepID=UPI003758016E